jgi:hypothetical protein
VRLVEAVAAERLDLPRDVLDRAPVVAAPTAFSTNLPSSFWMSTASFLPTALRSTSASASEMPASTCAMRITCSW